MLYIYIYIFAVSIILVPDFILCSVMGGLSSPIKVGFDGEWCCDDGLNYVVVTLRNTIIFPTVPTTTPFHYLCTLDSTN